MELLFYPSMCYPTIEREIHDGRKRIDLVFDNCAETGFFYRLSTTYKIPSPFIFVECKNYSNEISNPELDQLSGRFSFNRGRFGILTCRTSENYETLISRCRDTYKDDRGLIIPLIDEDLCNLLDVYDEQNSSSIDVYMQNKFRLIALS